eukprot:6207648-Pleurochrysis_carterae.AAC.1
METLRHLLSFIYDKDTDKYAPIRVWENPNDTSDFLVMTSLASRQSREKEFNLMADAADIVVSPNGHCQRDATALVRNMYVNFKDAMCNNFSTTRPAQPVLYLDATGAALGRGVTHCEIGSADFTGTTKQSRATLAPLAQYEGSDKAVPLREHLDLSVPSYNILITAASIKIDGEHVPLQPITSADMQGTKALYGMCQSSHSVWCRCRKGEQQHSYPRGPVHSYEEMLRQIEAVGCEMKSFDEICCLAHVSPSVARGGAFTPFTCPCCEYSPSESEAVADRREYESLSEKEQAQRISAHNEIGQAEHPLAQHHHQILYTPPLVLLGMARAGVDGLHLVFLNVFKHLLNYTIHQPIPGVLAQSVLYSLSLSLPASFF